MDKKKELKFNCTRCGNCCTDKYTFVNVTYSDILKIKNKLNLTLDETIEVTGFYIFDKNPDKESLKKMVVSPIETEKGLAFIGLLKKEIGDCIFYDRPNKKCLIYEIRPAFCQTFPFFFRKIMKKNKQTKIEIFYTEKGKQYCPGIGEKAPFIKKDEWITLGTKTLKKLNENDLIIQQWNDNVRKGKLKPSVRNFLSMILDLKEK